MEYQKTTLDRVYLQNKKSQGSFLRLLTSNFLKLAGKLLIRLGELLKDRNVVELNNTIVTDKPYLN